MSRIEQALEKAASSRATQTLGQLRSAADSAVEKSPPVKTPPVQPDHDKLLDVPKLKINNPMLVAMGDNKSIASEEYNKLRSLIVELTHGKEFHNTLLICTGQRL